MNAHEGALADRDWWAAHVLIAIFGVLVAAILVAVPGWSAPLHAWVALAALVTGVLACDACVRAVRCAARRQWHAALLGLALAAGLGTCGAGLMLFGHWSRAAVADPFAEAPPVVGRGTR
ncbi:MAG: hypothetical protein ACJ8G1_05280 [Vitreoscilla sp.]